MCLSVKVAFKWFWRMDGTVVRPSAIRTRAGTHWLECIQVSARRRKGLVSSCWLGDALMVGKRYNKHRIPLNRTSAKFNWFIFHTSFNEFWMATMVGLSLNRLVLLKKFCDFLGAIHQVWLSVTHGISKERPTYHMSISGCKRHVLQHSASTNNWSHWRQHRHLW